MSDLVKPAAGKFAPTAEQEAIRAAVAAGGASVMVEAGAGCAKTTTAKLAARGVKGTALALAFNKRIVQDLERALPLSWAKKSLNGLGHGAWARAVGADVQLQLDDRKLSRLLKELLRSRKLKLPDGEWEMIRALTRSAMQAGLVPGPSGPEGLVEDSEQGWSSVADSAGYLPDEVGEGWLLARELLAQGIEEAKQGVISFDDQIYCSVMLGGRFSRFGTVLVDEDQDLSMLNIRMLENCVAAEGRIIALGDKRQGIYAFRGASGQAAEEIRKLRPQWQELPLMTTFRCPKVVVERQQGHVPGFRAAEGNRVGEVLNWRSAPGGLQNLGPEEGIEWEGWSIKQFMELRSDGASTPTRAVLCRNNAPLLALAFKLIRQGIGPLMLGRDIGKGLVQLSRKLASEDGMPADQVRNAVVDWRLRETASAAAADREERIAGITDRAECLLAVLDSAECRDAGSLRRQLELVFAREAGAVTLSTIHRAKGLEWDVVMHLDPWRLPSKQARRAAAEGLMGAMEQELNLRYVCETRTKDTLVLASMGDLVG